MKDVFNSNFYYFSVTDYGNQFISNETKFPSELSICDLVDENQIKNERKYVMRTRKDRSRS